VWAICAFVNWVNRQEALYLLTPEGQAAYETRLAADEAARLATAGARSRASGYSYQPNYPPNIITQPVKPAPLDPPDVLKKNCLEVIRNRHNGNPAARYSMISSYRSRVKQYVDQGKLDQDLLDTIDKELDYIRTSKK